MSKKELEIEKMVDEINQLKNTEEVFLRKYGWKYSCDFPDCCWRWCKEINGRILCLSRDDAIRVEEES